MSLSLRVEHGRRLVQHDYLRLHGDNTGDGDALLLPAGEEMGGVLAQLIHADLRERRVHAAAYLLRRHAEVFRREGHVVLNDVRNDLVVRVLEHHADAAGTRMAFMCLASVDLPLPLCPSTAVNCPFSIARSIPQRLSISSPG